MSFLWLWLVALRTLLIQKFNRDVRVPILLSSLNKLGTSVSKFVVSQVALASPNPLRDLVFAQVAEWLPGAMATFVAGIMTDYRSHRLLYLVPNAALLCLAVAMAVAKPTALTSIFIGYALLGAFSAIPITALFRSRVNHPVRDGATRDIWDGLVQLSGPVLAGFFLFPVFGQKAILFDALSFAAVIVVMLGLFSSADFRNPAPTNLSCAVVRETMKSLLQYSRETGAIWLILLVSMTWGLRDTLGLLWLKTSLESQHHGLLAFLLGDTSKAVAAYYFAAAAGQIFGAWSIKEVTPQASEPNWRNRAMVLAGIGAMILAITVLMPCIGPMSTEHLIALRFLDGIGSTIVWSSLTTVIVLGTPSYQNGMAQALLKMGSGVVLSSVKLALFLPVTKELPLAAITFGLVLISLWLIKLNVHDE